MIAKYKVGDAVGVNDRYLMEGKHYFGKELRNKKFQGVITKVFENTNDQQDGFGDIWQNFYEFKSGLQICEIFLQLV